MSILGSSSRSALTTVSPPIPESKTPIGRESLMQRERGGVAAGPQPDCVAGLAARKQRPHARGSREKDLLLCSPRAHPYDTADEPNKSVILWEREGTSLYSSPL